MDQKELINRFRHHPPRTVGVGETHQVIRSHYEALAIVMNELAPDGREKSTCMTKLEESMFWANAAVARNQ